MALLVHAWPCRGGSPLASASARRAPDEPSEARAGCRRRRLPRRRARRQRRGDRLLEASFACRRRSERPRRQRSPPPTSAGRTVHVRSAGGTGRGRGGSRSRARGRRRLCARDGTEQPRRGDGGVRRGRAGDRVLRGEPGAPSPDRGRLPDRPVARQPCRDGAHEGEISRAAALFAEAAEIATAIGDKRHIIFALGGLGWVAYLERRWEDAARTRGRACASPRARHESDARGPDLLARRDRRGHGRPTRAVQLAAAA